MKARHLPEAVVVSPSFYFDPSTARPVVAAKRDAGLWIKDRFVPIDVERLPQDAYGVRKLPAAMGFTPGHAGRSAPPVGALAWPGTFVLDGTVHMDPEAALCAAGPISNTGLTGSLGEGQGGAPFAVSIDYLTLVFPDDGAKDQGQITKTICTYLFGTQKLIASELRAKAWQFYKLSAFIRDEDGNTVGRIGRGGNKDTWCVSLSGAGCRLVEDWQRVVTRANELRAHISRIDVAFDDFRGLVFDIHTVNAMAKDGLFAGNGAPPSTRFIDDHGSNKGCTVYVGGKGRKELCIYEKGKQLGDPESPWVRVELRLWARNCVVPMDAITAPERFLRGAYSVLAERLPVVETAEAARPEYTRREVDATAEGVKRFLKQQCGPSLQLLWSALGPNAVEWFRANVFRETLPSRFRGKGRDRESLLTLLREELGYAFEAPF